MSQYFILMGVSDGVEMGRKCEAVDRAGRGYDGVVRWRDYDAVGRAWGREREVKGGGWVGLARILDCY